MLSVLRDSHGGVVAVPDPQILACAQEMQIAEGIDAAPEGGATLAGAIELKQRGEIRGTERVVLLNTGAGWLYRG
jgi:threonine synthase